MANRNLSTSTKFLIPLVLLAIAAIGFFFFFTKNQRAEKKAISGLEEERLQWQEKVDNLEKIVAQSQSSGAKLTDDSQPVTKILPGAENIFGKANGTGEDACQSTIAQLDLFFSSLDEKPYIQEFDFQKGSKDYLSTIAKKLYDKTPETIRETDSLISVIQNTAHLYRVLGKHDLNILKTILENEKDRIEELFTLFFDAAEKNDECLAGKYPLTLPSEKLFAYSSFFLDTLGGQAYLFRRDPTTRTLVKYYCLLVLHRANELDINTSGIDIRHGLQSLIDELLAISVLQRRDAYLNTMLTLQAQYDQKYGL